MINPLDKIINWLTPTAPPTKESLDTLETKTKKLEKQAGYAEAEEKLLDRAKKAKARIKATKSYPHINTSLWFV